MKKLPSTFLLAYLWLVLSVVSTGCQKPAAPVKEKNTAPPAPASVAPTPNLELETPTVNLPLDETKSTDVIVKVKSGVAGIEGGKDGVTGKIVEPGRVAVKITAAKNAVPGEQVFTVKGMGMQKATLTVNVQGAKKDEGKKVDAKKDDTKKDAQKDKDAKKETSFLDTRDGSNYRSSFQAFTANGYGCNQSLWGLKIRLVVAGSAVLRWPGPRA